MMEQDLKEIIGNEYIVNTGKELLIYTVALIIFILFLIAMMPLTAAIWPFY